MNLIKEILHIQNYYDHPFKEICKNELIINTATNINYSVSRAMVPIYTLGTPTHTVTGKSSYSFSFFMPIQDKKLEIIREHKDIVLIINKNEITKHEIYIYIKNARISTRSEYRLQDEHIGLTYIEGESSDIIISAKEY